MQNYIDYINDQTNVLVSGITPPAIFTIDTFPLFFFFGGQSPNPSSLLQNLVNSSFFF